MGAPRRRHTVDDWHLKVNSSIGRKMRQIAKDRQKEDASMTLTKCVEEACQDFIYQRALHNMKKRGG